MEHRHASGAPMQNVELWTEPAAMAASDMPWPVPGASLRQVMPQPDRLAVLRIGKPVDRFMADRHAMLAAFQFQAAGDLFW